MGPVVAEDEAVVVGDGDLGKVGFVEVDTVDFFDGCSVEMDDTFFDFQYVPGQGDDSLDPALPTIRGVEEGDDVVVLWLAVAIAVLADEDFVTFVEGGAHRAAGHGEDVEKVFPDGEGETSDDRHHKEGESDIDGKSIVVFAAIVLSAGEGHSTGVPCGVGGGDD